jgi:hypothetical protein
MILSQKKTRHGGNMFQPHLAEQAERCSCSLPMAPSFWKPHPKKLRTKNHPPPIHTVLIRNLRGV